MDLRKKRAAPTAPMHLKDAAGQLMYSEGPDGQPDETKPCRVWLHGPASAIFIAQKRTLEREIMEAMKVASKDKNAPVPEVLTPARRAQFLAAITERFENVELTDDDGSTIADDALPLALFGDPALGYIADDADRFSQAWANFTKGSPTH